MEKFDPNLSYNKDVKSSLRGRLVTGLNRSVYFNTLGIYFIRLRAYTSHIKAFTNE